MGKRKHKHCDKDIRRKIRRLEDKLRHNKRKGKTTRYFKFFTKYVNFITLYFPCNYVS